MGKINTIKTQQQVMWEYDMQSKGCQYDYIMGCDESGRGAISGSIVAAAVILKPEVSNYKINDSKKMTEGSREKMYDIIINNCIAFNIEMLNANYIDTYGIQVANANVMKRSRENVLSKIDAKVLTIADGNSLWSDTDLIWVQHADAKSLSVAAASILAKVFRDRLMIELSDQYEGYYFHQHKGYGTKVHKNAIREYGKIRGIHRKTFTRDLPDIENIKMGFD